MRSRYQVALSHGSSLPQQRGQTAPLKVTKVTVTPRSSVKFVTLRLIAPPGLRFR